ncbi:MAG: alanine--tRNA ligase [Candidatus Omnitrophota bacterium]|jgi:alanyl-tRNA synthetase
MMRTDEIRRAYLEFFRSKSHEMVPSDSLVPKDDPSLLFTGAGMNQFKEKFMGRNVTYKRAATSQKCLRTGDLDNVGKTSGHHTFFEMLGNFSFGDYFKKEAIQWAWEFLTITLKISPDKLWVSVYKDDDEAYAIWRDSVKIPENRIVRLGEKDNFWPSEAPTKGPNGPCGPCSEIFFDRGEGEGCGKSGCSPACDCKRFVEIWNLVFTQFDRQPDGSLKPLPNKNIDTGMGLERIAAVMQGVKTNFEIDIFKSVIDMIKKESKASIQVPKVNAIADHIRAVTFSISDGVMPSNEERGYVIRKLVRRSIGHAIDLGIRAPFLYKLVSAIVDSMKSQYPELLERRDEIAQVVKREEENFMTVLDTQIPKVEEAFKKLSQAKDASMTAIQAFDFYDTYGMPYDMLEEIAQKSGLKIDNAAFEKLLDEQRSRSRAKSKIKSEIFTETFAKKVEALGLKTEFLGYEKAHAEAKVLEVLEGGEVILDRTPFYGESGGQAGDWGEIETPSGKMKVEDAKKIGSTIVHVGTLVKGRIEKGEIAKATIDEVVRKKTMSNHTATHLLQAALRKVLGEHVHQTGSLVDESHLRFDFTHMAKMEARELARVEELVNESVKKHIKVNKEVKGLEAAKIDGATALFGEKYDSIVRVVTIADISKELCGGTHVDNTGDIGMFRITSESSIASGVRRIEAVTGEEAVKWVACREEKEKEKARLQDVKEAHKKASETRLKQELEKVDDLVAKAKNIGNIKFVCEVIDDAEIDILRAISDKVKLKSGSAAVVLATKKDGKVTFVTSVTEDMIKNNILSANDMAKELAKALGGSGGGKPGFAQGGGKDPAQLDGALNRIYEIVRGKIK